MRAFPTPKNAPRAPAPPKSAEPGRTTSTPPLASTAKNSDARDHRQKQRVCYTAPGVDIATPETARPAIMSYPGGQGASGVAQTIINQQPPHRVYIEPFLGGGAVMRAKRPAADNIGIDEDAGTIAAFDDGTRSHIRLITGDALDWLASTTVTADTLIYADPPYPLDSRMRARQIYRHEFTQDQHQRLLWILKRLPCMVQISTYPNDLYAAQLKDWRLLSFQGMSRGGPMIEHLYMNYAAPQALHDYRYLGANFRQRERIQRKTKRWTARIARLPELERLALMSAMASTIAGESDEQPLRVAPLSTRLKAAPVTVLFAHRHTHYRELPGVEVYDQARDARTWPGGTAVIAHPPCAQWGRLRQLATTNPEEKALGPFAVDQVRTWGGVLEHPAGSTLWSACEMPQPGQSDKYGGWTLDIDQVVFGHPAQKRTWLYICGCRPGAIPAVPAPGKQPTRCVTSSRNSFYRLPELSKRGRELTPPDLCAWLVAVARLCSAPASMAAANAPS